MKILFTLLLLAAIHPAFGAQEPELPGTWIFYKKVFRDQEMPEPPNATLRMHFQFTAEAESRLWWWHEGESDHCERKGIYTLEDGILVDEVTWLNPDNTADCSNDPDMQLGKVNKTPYKFRGPDLSLELHLNGEPLSMVWKRVEAQPGQI